MSKELTWFYMFKEHKRTIEKMSPDMLKRILLYLFDYFETGVEPDLNGEDYFAFCVLKKGVELAKEHFTNNQSRAIKGAQARWHNTEQKPLSKPEQEEKIKQEVKQDLNKPKAEKKKTSQIFKPPTLDEIREYCKEKGYSIDPEYFYNYQEARDWVLSNGKKMKKWTATIDYWQRNDYNRGRKNNTEDLSNDTTGYGDDSELWASYTQGDGAGQTPLPLL